MHKGVHFRKAEAEGTEAQEHPRPWRLLVRATAVVVPAVVVALVVVASLGSHTSGQKSLSASNAVASPSEVNVSSPQQTACSGLVCPDSAAAGAASASPTTSTTSPVTATPATATPASTTPASTTPVTAGPASTGASSAAPTVLPDGSPPPVLMVFDGDTVTLSGAVPSQAAGSRLAGLAQSYSKTPNATVVNNLVVDPRTPGTVGVRVIEMNASRFPTGVSAVSPEYAAGLSRVVAAMKAIPTVSVLVVGHADQQGASDQNLALSQARALAVVQYLVSQGISPDRLSARGLGDRDLLTQQSDAAGLALNRRTEFVFFGLLIGA